MVSCDTNIDDMVVPSFAIQCRKVNGAFTRFGAWGTVITGVAFAMDVPWFTVRITFSGLPMYVPPDNTKVTGWASGVHWAVKYLGWLKVTVRADTVVRSNTCTEYVPDS